MKSLLPAIIVLCTGLANNSALAAADQPTQPVAGQAQNDNASANEKLAAPRFSRGVDDIVKLTQAKVSDSVILAYVRNSSVPYRPSADEIIELRQLGVSEPVMTGMLDRGNELRQAAAARAQAAAQAESQLAATPTTSQPVTVTYMPSSPTYYNYVYLPSYGYPIYSSYYPRYYHNYYPYRRYIRGLGYGGYYAGYRGGYRRYW